MTTTLKLKLTALLTTIALAAVPATDAFANRSWTGHVHHNHRHFEHHFIVLGRSWN